MWELLPLPSVLVQLLVSATHLERQASTTARLREVQMAAPPPCTHTAKLVVPHGPCLPWLHHSLCLKAQLLWSQGRGESGQQRDLLFLSNATAALVTSILPSWD